MHLNRAVNPSTIKNKLVGTATYSAGTTSALDVTISSVNIAKSILVFSVRSAAVFPAMTGVFVNATTLRFKIDAVSSSAGAVEYSVIEYV